MIYHPITRFVITQFKIANQQKKSILIHEIPGFPNQKEPYDNNYQKLKRSKVWFALAFLGLLIGFISQQDDRPAGAIEYSKNSRKTTYLLTLELIKENPVIGIGYGKFLNSFREYYAERKSTDPKIQLLGNNNMDHPHIEILYSTVEGAIDP